MITFSKLGRHGQLGNQLFQYAMLLGVAAKRGYAIRVPKDTSSRKKHGLYELDKLSVTSQELTAEDLRGVYNSYSEKGFAFDPAVFEQLDYTDYDGYYQTEKYFTHAASAVRSEYKFIEPIAKWAKKFVEGGRTSDCVVAIHVRRGDYLHRPDLFQVLSSQYYEKAREKFPGQHLVFSDDLSWCKENLSHTHTKFVVSPSHWHDLAAMACCDAHIMSASSFSWWGAWLSKSARVIAPTPWFPMNGPRQSYNMQDIIPKRWAIQIAS
jgi:hypothetical protein